MASCVCSVLDAKAFGSVMMGDYCRGKGMRYEIQDNELGEQHQASWRRVWYQSLQRRGNAERPVRSSGDITQAPALAWRGYVVLEVLLVRTHPRTCTASAAPPFLHRSGGHHYWWALDAWTKSELQVRPSTCQRDYTSHSKACSHVPIL